MKKIGTALIAFLVLTSLVTAAMQQGQPTASPQPTATITDTLDNSNPGNQQQNQEANRVRIRTGNYITSNGQHFEIQEQTNNRLRLKSGNITAETDLNLTQTQEQNRTRIHIQLSNGQNAEVKIMPDTASETALERLRLRVCTEENNCTIQLKETGQGNESKLSYEIHARKQVKVLGIFRKQMQVQAEVSAENGEVIRTGKPWWAFLAKETED